MEKYTDFIEVNPKVMLGKSVNNGTRITVDLILEKLSAGESMDEILKAHPRLSEDAILASIGFAATILKGDKLLIVGGRNLSALREACDCLSPGSMT